MIGFKKRIKINLVVRTPEEDLVYCDVCGGINASASVAAKIDCEACDTTGYQNLWARIPAVASYRPGSIERWDQLAGHKISVGDCSIKLDHRFAPALGRVEWIEMNSEQWNFRLLRDPGVALGQPRLILGLSRKSG